MLMVPIVNLDLAKRNFIFQASCIWNSMNKKVLNQCLLSNRDGILIPDSTFGSDMYYNTYNSYKEEVELLDTQASDPLNSDDWYPNNFYQVHCPV